MRRVNQVPYLTTALGSQDGRAMLAARLKAASGRSGERPTTSVIDPDEARERAQREAERPQREARLRAQRYVDDALEDRRRHRIEHVRQLAKIEPL